MKKLVLGVAAACAVAVAAVGVAFAGGGGTVVASGFPCGILDGNGNVFITTDSEIIVHSNTQGSKAVMHCTGNGAGAPTLTYFNYANTGLTCGMLDFGSTTEWVDKVGVLGNSQLTCVQRLSGPTSAATAGAGLG
jgi:hypothetical protein